MASFKQGGLPVFSLCGCDVISYNGIRHKTDDFTEFELDPKAWRAQIGAWDAPNATTIRTELLGDMGCRLFTKAIGCSMNKGRAIYSDVPTTQGWTAHDTWFQLMVGARDNLTNWIGVEFTSPYHADGSPKIENWRIVDQAGAVYRRWFHPSLVLLGLGYVPGPGGMGGKLHLITGPASLSYELAGGTSLGRFCGIGARREGDDTGGFLRWTNVQVKLLGESTNMFGCKTTCTEPNNDTVDFCSFESPCGNGLKGSDQGFPIGWHHNTEGDLETEYWTGGEGGVQFEFPTYASGHCAASGEAYPESCQSHERVTRYLRVYEHSSNEIVLTIRCNGADEAGLNVHGQASLGFICPGSFSSGGDLIVHIATGTIEKDIENIENVEVDIGGGLTRNDVHITVTDHGVTGSYVISGTETTPGLDGVYVANVLDANTLVLGDMTLTNIVVSGKITYAEAPYVCPTDCADEAACQFTPGEAEDSITFSNLPLGIYAVSFKSGSRDSMGFCGWQSHYFTCCCELDTEPYDVSSEALIEDEEGNQYIEITTTGAHGKSTGDTIEITGDGAMNGQHTITVTAPNKFVVDTPVPGDFELPSFGGGEGEAAISDPKSGCITPGQTNLLQVTGGGWAWLEACE